MRLDFHFYVILLQDKQHHQFVIYTFQKKSQGVAIKIKTLIWSATDDRAVKETDLHLTWDCAKALGHCLNVCAINEDCDRKILIDAAKQRGCE